MRACVLIRTVTETFQQSVLFFLLTRLLMISSYDSDRDGWIQLNYEQLLAVSRECCENCFFSSVFLPDRAERSMSNLRVLKTSDNVEYTA